MENLKAFVHRGRGRTEDGQWLLVNTPSESSTDEDFTTTTENPMRPRSYLVESREEERPSRKSSSNSSDEIPKSNEDSRNKTEHVTNEKLMPHLTRRNAICDVIERRMYSGPRSLRKEREDLLRCITLGNYSLL